MRCDVAVILGNYCRQLALARYRAEETPDDPGTGDHSSFLGMHFLSDVLVGSGMGALAGYVARKFAT